MQNAPIEHSAILLTLIKLPVVFKTFVLSIFDWPLKTGFTVFSKERGEKAQRMFMRSQSWDFNIWCITESTSEEISIRWKHDSVFVIRIGQAIRVHDNNISQDIQIWQTIVIIPTSNKS